MTIPKLFLLFSMLWLSACGSDTVAPDMPAVLVNEQLNLTNIQYNRLRQDNGFVYIAGGIRGIIVLHQTAGRYLAFERACPYHPGDACGKVEMDASGLFMTDPCCGSQFDLSGQVSAGPARYPLRQYATATSGNFLYITN